MAIIASVRCRRIEVARAFYTKILDFDCVEDGGATDPTFSVLMRGGDLLFLSSHGGDGTFGQAIAILTDSVDAVFHKFRSRGLKTPGDPASPQEVHEGPIDQSWGTREFYVNDPDGNTLRFIEGFGLNPCPESAT